MPQLTIWRITFGSSLNRIWQTLQVGRRTFNHRRILVCRDANEAAELLANRDPKRVFSQIQDADKRSVAFLFPGQGAQYVNMGLGLYDTEPTFRAAVDTCCEILKPLMGIDLRSLLYPLDNQADEATRQLQQTAITQPAIFVIEYAIAQLLMEWGIRPAAVIGHSIGEYAAACLAGVFSLEDALALVTTRAQLMQSVAAGTMLSVLLPEKEVQQYLGAEVSLAAVNAPNQCVLSGPTDAIEAIRQQLAAQGIQCVSLHTSHAFHSSMMDQILKPFGRRVKTVTLHAPQIPWISTVTGKSVTAHEVTDPAYWVKNLRHTVYFAEGVRQLFSDPSFVLLEVGPGRTLSTLAKQHAEKPSTQITLSSLRHPQDKQSDTAFMLTTVGQLWLQGAQIDWAGFSTHEIRRRIPLPTYPFERQRYWIEPTAQPQEKAASGKKPDIADWFYVPSWKRMPPLTLFSTVFNNSIPSSWLIFLDDFGIGAQLTNHLQQQGQEVITVRKGTAFAKLSDHEFVLNPLHDEEYVELHNHLLAGGKAFNQVVHLWSLSIPDPMKLKTAEHDKARRHGFYSLLFWAQAIEKSRIDRHIKLTVISNNMQEIIGAEVVIPEHTMLLGPCMVIPQEYPQIICRSIDIQLDAPDEFSAMNQLWAELVSDATDQIVSYRGQYRWVSTFEPIHIPAVANQPSRLRENGVYLIIGGLGHIGLILSEYLAADFHAKLILTGRSPFPEKERWKEWLNSHDEQDSISLKIQKIQHLETLGAEVLTASVDVADEQQMRSLLIQAEQRFGRIHGVIHAAGVLGAQLFTPIASATFSGCEQQFHPKIQGILALEQVLQDKELDFCIIFSSLSSVLGGSGFTAYSAANLFMDAFVERHNRSHSLPWSSVNWDAWHGTSYSLTSQEGIEVFQRLLAAAPNINQIVISTGDLGERRKQAIPQQEFRESQERADKHTPQSFHVRPNLQIAYAAPRNQIEITLSDMWQQMLGIEHVGIHDDFFELGGDSLLGTQIISRVRETFKVELPVGALFENPTIAGIAEYIHRNKQPISQKHDENREEGEL